MKPLEQFLAEAKLQRAAIKAEIGTISNAACFYVIEYLCILCSLNLRARLDER